MRSAARLKPTTPRYVVVIDYLGALV